MKSRHHAAGVLVLLAAVLLFGVGCSPQEPAAPAADEPAAETTTQEPAAEFSADFETGDTAEWSNEDATDTAEESAASEDPASAPEASDE